jgi:hypothetical protein
VQGFDSGGESARSFRARFAEAAFDLLHQDNEDFFAEYKKMESDPYAYFLSVTELRRSWVCDSCKGEVYDRCCAVCGKTKRQRK